MVFIKKNPSIITLNTTTSYLCGVIVGDGHIYDSFKSKESKFRDFRISIHLTDKEYLQHILDLIKTIIPTKSTLKCRNIRKNRLLEWSLNLRNKELFIFLNEIMKIPKGPKSKIIRVPPKIKSSSEIIKKYFLAGYFDTDGGFRGETLGFTTASKQFNEDVSGLLTDFKIIHFKERWLNKKYDRYYYGIKIKKSEINTFLNLLPLQNKEKLFRIQNRFFCGDAGVAKRDRFSIRKVQA